MLGAGALLVALPLADLLQRAQLAGGAVEPTPHRLPLARQRLCGDSRIGDGPSASLIAGAAANRCYLEFLAALEDPRAGVDKLGKLSRTVRKNNDRAYRSFNFFDEEHQTLFEVIARGEFNNSGLKNRTLRRWLSGYSSGQVWRLLKRLQVHGLIKRVGRTYKYYLTSFGKQVIATGLKLKELFLIPQLRSSPAR